MLAHEDRRLTRASLALALVLTPGLSLYFDVGAVYFTFGVLLAWLLVRAIWSGVRMKRTGYDERGSALLRGAAELAAGLVLLLAAFLIQSEFQLWFAQHRFCRYC